MGYPRYHELHGVGQNLWNYLSAQITFGLPSDVGGAGGPLVAGLLVEGFGLFEWLLPLETPLIALAVLAAIKAPYPAVALEGGSHVLASRVIHTFVLGFPEVGKRGEPRGIYLRRPRADLDLEVNGGPFYRGDTINVRVFLSPKRTFTSVKGR